MKHLYKRIILGFAVIAFIGLPHAAHGMMMEEMTYPGNVRSGFFGQEHKYSVTLRGNGDASVIGRFSFTNQTEKPLSDFVLRVPAGIVIEQLSAYQLVRERACVRYSTYPIPEPSYYPVPYYPDYPQSPTLYDDRFMPPSPRTQMCLEYQQPDYYSDYWNGGTKYHKAPITAAIDTLTISLPEPVEVNKEGSVVLYFRSPSYTDAAWFGGRAYSFETLGVDDRISYVTVGVSADQDQRIRGGDSSVFYTEPAQVFDAAMPAYGGMMTNTKLDTYLQQVGYGQVTKSASDLQPLDSFTVRGTYAESIFGLYGKEMFFAVAGLLLFIVGVYVLGKFLYRRFVAPPVVEGGLAHVGVSEHGRDIALVAGVSFITAFGVGVIGAIFIGVMWFFGGYIPYEFQIFVGIVGGLGSLFVIVILAAPSIIFGIKKGAGYGIATFLATVVWLLLFSFAVLIFSSIQWRSSGFYPTPMMQMMKEGSVEPVAIDSSY